MRIIDVVIKWRTHHCVRTQMVSSLILFFYSSTLLPHLLSQSVFIAKITPIIVITLIKVMLIKALITSPITNIKVIMRIFFKRKFIVQI